MEEKINITVPENYDGKPIILNLMEGELPDPINLINQTYSGDIHAISEYIKRDFPKDDAIIVFDENNKSIQLVVQPNHPHKITVNSSLSFAPAFAKFGIETSKRFTVQELKGLIRINRMYFPDKDAHGKLLANLQKLDLKITEVIKEEDDSRGNTKDLLETKVISNVDERFTMELPVYKGIEPAIVEVNICLEKRDKGVSIWLESPELLEWMESKWRGLVEAKSIEFKRAKITTINK